MTTDVSVIGTPEEINRLIEDGQDRTAWAAMLHLLGEQPTTANCQTAADLASRLDAKRAELVPLRIALLSNFTIDPLAPILSARALPSRILVSAYVGGFDAWAQELVQPNGALDEFDAQAVVLSLRLELLCPTLATGFLDLSPERATALVDETAQRIAAALRGFRARSRAKILLHTFPVPPYPAFGIADSRSEHGQSHAVRALNDRLATLVTELGDAFLIDSDRLVARVGETQWNDARMAAFAKLPLAPSALHACAEEYLRYLRAFCGVVRKVLVVDLDNTLWGGIVGEDGLEGIQLGEGYPGSAYVELQEAILQLHRRGVVLAINSHNNPEDVAEVFARHPAMRLKEEHFASIQVNWNDKAENMQVISAQLGLGLDSFVFLDDSDANVARMRQALPEVLTLQQRGEQAHRPAALRALGVFDALSYSEEDRARGSFYRTEVQRAQLNDSVHSLEDFLGSLEMELFIERIGARNLQRCAELTQRTNQFNLTTVRYTPDAMTSFLAAADAEGFAFRLRDRFGDSGTIAVALLNHKGGVTVIDTLLISCRVLKRTVEDAIVGFLSERAARAGSRHLRGLFRATKKNAQVAGFFPSRGFVESARSDDGTIAFEYDLSTQIASSPWINITFSE